MRPTTTFFIGAGTAYFFDRRLGKSRRTHLRARSRRLLRAVDRAGMRKVKHAEGRARGMVARARRAVARPAVDLSDTTVVQRIRSEALRDVGVSTRDVEVAVDHGVATVEGTVDDRKVADDLVTRVSKVPGVDEVAAIIRVSGEPSDTT